MADDPSNSTTLSHLRHELRTALNHVLGYNEMLFEAASEAGDTELCTLLHDIRTEAQGILRLVETCLSVTDESAPSIRLDDLNLQVRDPLHRLVRMCATLMSQAHDEMLQDAMRVSMASNKLMQLISLGSMPLTNTTADAGTGAVEVPLPIPGAHLLVVDDDEANRDIMSRMLSRLGYKVDTAEGGEDALSCMRRHQYDLVLLDVMMPGMDGRTVLSEMQKDERIREIPVVMVSATDEVSSVVACMATGAIDYFFKPFNSVLLRARLVSALERKRLLDDERARTRELETLSSELRRSNEDLERFAYAVSHDLQSPLRTMVSFMQLTQRRLAGHMDAESEKLIADAVAAGKRMSQLVKDLLTYSQVSTQQLRSEDVVLSEVLREVLADLQPQVEEAGATVTFGEMPTIQADRVRMRQLFQNLIGNAIKYRSERPPEVRVTSRRSEGGWAFAVADNGLGIRKEDIPNIFQMFSRLHGPSLPGSGIGLATCLRIVERMGGAITVQSEPGEGSVFEVVIPAAGVAASRA